MDPYEDCFPESIERIVFENNHAPHPLGNQCIAEGVSKILSRIPKNAKILSIDGWSGVGKSTLGREISLQGNYNFYDLDDFLNQNQDKYFEALRLAELSSIISSTGASRVAVAGCLVGRALMQCHLVADFRIYVARASGSGLAEFDFLCGAVSTKSILEIEKGAAAILNNRFSIPALERELIDYHRDQSPHRDCDLIIIIKC